MVQKSQRRPGLHEGAPDDHVDIREGGLQVQELRKPSSAVRAEDVKNFSCQTRDQKLANHCAAYGWSGVGTYDDDGSQFFTCVHNHPSVVPRQRRVRTDIPTEPPEAFAMAGTFKQEDQSIIGSDANT